MMTDKEIRERLLFIQEQFVEGWPQIAIEKMSELLAALEANPPLAEVEGKYVKVAATNPAESWEWLQLSNNWTAVGWHSALPDGIPVTVTIRKRESA